MATHNLADLEPFVLTELPKCPPALLLQETRNVIMLFCEESRQWRVELDAIAVTKDLTTYDLERPYAYSSIIMPTKVVYDGITLAADTDYKMTTRTEMELQFTPDKDLDEGLVVTVALRPAPSATVIDGRLFEDWYQVWGDGVKGALMRMSDQAWTDPNMAPYYWRQFMDGIARARVDRIKGGTNRTLIARPRFKFA